MLGVDVDLLLSLNDEIAVWQYMRDLRRERRGKRTVAAGCTLALQLLIARRRSQIRERACCFDRPTERGDGRLGARLSRGVRNTR